MTTLTITFQVDANSTLTEDDLYELADRVVAEIDPDPPVLTYVGSEVLA